MKASDNKEERRFTLRLTPTESSMIESLKGLMHENTDSGAVRSVIMNYASIDDSLKKERQKNAILAQERDELQSKIEFFCKAFDQLVQCGNKRKK